MFHISEESRQKGAILALSFGGDRYFAAEVRARIRVKFPRIYAQLDWILMKIQVRRLLRFVMSSYPKRKQPILLPFRSEEEIRRWLKKVNKANIGRSIVISGSGEKLKSYLDDLGLSKSTFTFPGDQVGQAGASADLENIDSQVEGQPLEHPSAIAVLDAIKKTTEAVCDGERRRYSAFGAYGLYGGVVTGMVRGCCLNCIFCWSEIGLGDESHHPFYSPEEVLAQLSWVAGRYGTAKARLSGGEPTIGREHLLSLLSLVEKSRFKIFILETNGIYFGLDRDYVKQVSRFKKVHIRLSLKAGTAEAFTFRTGIEPQAFSLPFTAIENLMRCGCRFNISAMTDSRVMHSAERQSLLGRLNSIDLNLEKDLEEESIEPYKNSLLRLKKRCPLKWPLPIGTAVDLPIRY